ncbi:MAG: MAPEG family protein [Hyphomicrobiaceae bacterium]
MTPDIKYLVWSAALTLVQAVIAVLGAVGAVGLATLAGNRDALPAIGGWAGRAARAHRNMLESLVLFAILVFAAHLAGRANATTALGAAIFFWARVAYAAVYTAGLAWVRTGVWAVSVVGLIMIFLQLL